MGNAEFIKNIQSTYESALRELLVEPEGDPDFESLIAAIKPVEKKIDARKEIAKFYPGSQALFFMYNRAYSRLSKIFKEGTERPTEKTHFTKYVSPAVIKEMAKEFGDFLNGLPYPYYVYFQVGFDLPPAVREVKVTEAISIVRIKNPEELGFPEVKKDGSEIAELFVERLETKRPKLGEIYIRCKGLGHSRYSLEGSATKQAYRLLKQFVYLGLSTGVFETPYVSSSQMIDTKCFVIQDDLLEVPMIIDLPENVKKLLSGLSVKDGVLENKPSFAGLGNYLRDALGAPSEPSVFEDPTATASKNLLKNMKRSPLVLANPKIATEDIERSLEWGFEGLVNHDKINGFIQTCIALEAILGRTERNSDDMLATRCAYLLGESRADRNDILKSFKDIYSLRSTLIHGSAVDVGREEKILIGKAEKYLEKCILKEISLADKEGGDV